jgi:hypothetical protein
MVAAKGPGRLQRRKQWCLAEGDKVWEESCCAEMENWTMQEKNKLSKVEGREFQNQVKAI